MPYLQVVGEILAALEDASGDENVGVVIMAGAGEKAFSAGDDVGAKDREIW